MKYKVIFVSSDEDYGNYNFKGFIDEFKEVLDNKTGSLTIEEIDFNIYNFDSIKEVLKCLKDNEFSFEYEFIKHEGVYIFEDRKEILGTHFIK